MIAASAAASLRRFNRRQQRRPQAHHANRAATMKLLRELGCVSYWPMNGDDGDRLSGNNLTRVNAPTNVPAPLGGSAIKTNGTTSYGTVAHSATLAFTNLTISAWIVPHALSGGRPLIFKGDTYPTNTDWYIWLEDTLGAGEFSTKIGGTVTGLAFSLSGFSVGKLAHLVATYDGANRRVYLDGVQIASDAKSGNLNNSSGTLRFGQYATYYLSATVYDLALWGRGIDGQEVKRLYDHYRTRGGPQVDGRRRNIVSRYDPTPYERSFRLASGGAWNDVNDSLVSDSSYATCETYDTVVPLEISDEGRLIPSAPTGFQVEIDAFASVPDSNIYSIEVFKNGVSVWSEVYGYGVNNLTSSLATYTWGNSTELFDTTWTANDAFSVTIQFYIGANATDTVYVDGARLTTWYSDGSTQTITMTVASATASASAPTVTPAATVTMPTASSTAAAIVPTVTPGATSITIGTCSATAAASAPTLTPTVTIVSPTASATASASTPTITAGTSTITVTTASATGTASAPTITPTVDIASPTASATAAATAPSVTAGATTITVTTGTATATATAPDVTNATLITPGEAVATASAIVPTVTPGGATITVGVVSGTAAAVDVAVSAGTTTITVGVASAVAGVSELVISAGGETAGALLFTAYVTASIRSLTSLQPSLDADANLRPSIEGKVS